MQSREKTGEIVKRIESAFGEYLSLLDSSLANQPLVYVKVSDEKKRKRHYPIFMVDSVESPPPATAGVYFVYRIGETKPFYCGESNDLQYRLTYHFSDWKDALRNSTLKKAFEAIGGGRSLRLMAEELVMRYFEVPIGRNDVEEYFHQKFEINTRKARSR